jgi:hypothetical protein
MADVTEIRDPATDALLTPGNCVVAFIDYQREQYAGVASMPHDELVANVTLLGQVVTAFEVPVVLSTVYVRHGMSGTNDELRAALPGVPEIDRTDVPPLSVAGLFGVRDYCSRTSASCFA